jgi:hypothetical protein
MHPRIYDIPDRKFLKLAYVLNNIIMVKHTHVN